MRSLVQDAHSPPGYAAASCPTVASIALRTGGGDLGSPLVRVVGVAGEVDLLTAVALTDRNAARPSAAHHTCGWSPPPTRSVGC